MVPRQNEIYPNFGPIANALFLLTYQVPDSHKALLRSLPYCSPNTWYCVRTLVSGHGTQANISAREDSSCLVCKRDCLQVSPLQTETGGYLELCRARLGGEY